MKDDLQVIKGKLALEKAVKEMNDSVVNSAALKPQKELVFKKPGAEVEKEKPTEPPPRKWNKRQAFVAQEKGNIRVSASGARYRVDENGAWRRIK